VRNFNIITKIFRGGGFLRLAVFEAMADESFWGRLRLFTDRGLPSWGDFNEVRTEFRQFDAAICRDFPIMKNINTT
jgi:hypothetical protein